MNDLNSCLKHSQSILFADDTTVFIQSPWVIHESDFDKKEMVKWLQKNHLKLNKCKCMMLEFGLKKLSQWLTEDYQLVYSHKNLGVILDSELQFQLNTQQVIRKMNQFRGLAHKAGNFFSRRQVDRFYDALRRSM